MNLLRRLPTLGLTPLPKVIVLTNYADPEYRRRASDAGCDYFLDKSSDFCRVGEVLDQLAHEQRRTAD